MSASDGTVVDVTGQSSAAEPVQALRQALTELGGRLAAAGAAPHQMTEMIWETPVPKEFDPARHDFDLCYREIFGGFRPPIRFSSRAGGSLVVRARAHILIDADPRPLWHGLARAELGKEYSPRGQVADMSALFAQWSMDGEAFRVGRGDVDLAYGPTMFETFDLYRPATGTTLPLWVFIHGGYWQASDKSQHSQFAAGMLQAGFAVANLNYALCPEVPLAGIVVQIRSALRFLAATAERYKLDPASMHIAGHSAGGHLAAMAAVDPEGPPLRSALLLSGLFDLTPLSYLPVGRVIGVTNEQAVLALSPSLRGPPVRTKVAVAVGGRESDEFKWQSTDLAQRWDLAPPLVVEGANHFELLEGLIEGELLDLARRTAS